MRGKVCMVTGANSGLGLVTVHELARRGAEVVLVCRDAAKGQRAIDEVRAAVPGSSLDLLLADFASLDDVRRLARDYDASGRRLDVLVNNAGLMLTERRTTRDGFEYTFAVNHLAPFLLTNLLLDSLRRSGSSRIVNVASRAHTRASLDFDDLNSERRFDGWTVYCRSKLCNVLFNRELARRIAGSGVTANALHPGVIATGFGREATGLWKWALALARSFMATPEKGADTQVYLACAPEVAGVNGAYFVNRRQVATSAAGADEAAARRLWETSARMVALPG
jgi:NAD(P)-dependent dehydrogenase (short-subunit alcohol dehydrogenase family)